MSELREEFLVPSKLQVRKSNLAGYGVFALEDIKDEEVIEESCFIRTKYRANDLLYPQLRQVCYTYPCPCDDCKYRGQYLLICSGYTQVYNHKKEGSVKFDYDLKKRMVRVIATKDIKKGEEILHNYGESYGENLMGEIDI